MKKAMFFPFSGNFGPLVNCCAIAEQLYLLGYQICFANTGYYTNFIDQSKYSIMDTLRPSWVSTPKTPESKPFSRIRSCDAFATSSGFSNYEWLEAYTRDQINVVKRFAPDVIIGSWDFTLGITGELLSIPVVNIFQEPMHPSSKGFEWWNPESSAMNLPQTNLPTFNTLLKNLGLSQVRCMEEICSKGDLLIMPSLPELEPISVRDLRIYYVGYMTWKGNNQTETLEVLNKMQESKNDWLYVYDHSISYGLRTLAAAVELYGNKDVNVVAVVGPGAPIHTYPVLPQNMHYYGFVSQDILLPRVSAAIIHGAVGSVMSCIHYATPNVSIPTTSEREYYAKRIESLNAGSIIDLANISPATLLHAVEFARSETTLGNLRSLSTESHKLGGAQKAAQLINSLVI